MGNIPGWKKTQDKPLVYTKRTKRDIWVGMRYYQGIWHTILPRGTRKKFKTEKQAKAYIIRYMKAHPRG